MTTLILAVSVIVRKEEGFCELEYQTYSMPFISLFEWCDSGCELDGTEDFFLDSIKDEKYSDGYYELYGRVEAYYSKDYWGEVDVDHDFSGIMIKQLTKEHKEYLVDYLNSELQENLLFEGDKEILPQMVPFDVVVKDEN